MKILFSFLLVLITVNIVAQKTEMPIARFNTGNDINWSHPEFDDSHWTQLKTNSTWDGQGYGNYDGYAWYRMHVTIPFLLKSNSFLKDSLRIYLAKIDDCDEVYLNGTLISKSGSLPEEKDGYHTTWNKVQEIHLSSQSPLIKWDSENIIAVKVYDGGGAGGIFGGMPSVSMIDLIDGIAIDAATPSTNEGQFVTVKNNSTTTVNGSFKIEVMDEKTGSILSSEEKKISVNKKPSTAIFVKRPANKDHVSFVYSFTEEQTKKVITVSKTLPYILTPKATDTPKINGAKVFGVRPNAPFLFKIAATGKKPLQYSAENLPEGLKLNPVNGVITGSIANKGDYRMTFVVKNSIGTNRRTFTVQCGDVLALTPPMGWNSWNCWGLSVSDEKLKASANAMMDKGLIDHGWSFMNIDDGWEAAARNSKGEIIANKKFPDMKKLGDWLHGNGLKFGIYSSPGPTTCGGYLGSYLHEEQDAATYASWGIDYLKYDWCSYGDIHGGKDESLESYTKPYQVMRDALLKQPRDIIYSLCQYGMKDVWQWGASVNGNCWRTTGDITDTWESLSGIGFKQTVQYPYAKPGRWNDPDMMIVGQVGWGDNLHPTRLTPDEQYTHVSLWSMLSSPLLIGCDISKLDDFTLNLLTNDEVIAIDQDPLGKQAQQVIKTDTYQIWIKDLEDGSKAMGIFNLGDKYDVIRFRWEGMGLAKKQQVRDVWRQKELGNFDSMFATKVAPHGVTLIKISASKK